MFMFNKSNALPRSRQSSIDSLVTDPSTSTSTSDVWVSQSSETSSYGELPSPEQRDRPYAGKRASVFNLRSRSNTATSMTPSVASFSTMTGVDGSRWTPQEYRHTAEQSLIEGGKRSLFARGRRGKRSSGHISSSPTVDESEELDIGSKRASVLRKSRRGVHQSEASVHQLKHRISRPFDFQHLTHTDRHQFQAIERGSDFDLVAEFSAVRASQAPKRDLTGIKADDLHFHNFSSENLAAQEPRAASAFGFRSPPRSPEPSHQWQQSQSPSQEPIERTIRHSRSVESFSQPGVRPRSHRHTQSAIPPPRVSSRLALARIEDMPEEPSENQDFRPPSRSRSNRSSGMWDHFPPLSRTFSGERLPTIADEPSSIAHAVTTPDDSAIHPMTPPFSPALENVIEESDRFVSPRAAPHPPVRSPKSPRSPFFESFSFRGGQRSPIARTNNRNSPFTSPKSANQRGTMTRPISQMSDTLGSPTLSRRASIRKAPTARRKSNTWRVIDECWEDDVDYIYEHALEADCDFDWDRMSDDGTFEDRDRTPEQDDHISKVSQAAQSSATQSEDISGLHGRLFSGSFRPSLLVPSINSIPELEARSAVSASTADTGIRTPSDPFSGMEVGYGLAPSPLSSQEFKDPVPREEMYDDLLADYEGSDRHYPLIDASQSVSSSSRSSHVRSSKRSSYDSSLVSSVQTSGSWSSPVRRSASSSGSLPELVHSRRARRDFNVMVEQLTEQVASFRTFGEDEEENEDNDTTPPGRPSQDRTFFAADEEERNPRSQSSIEGDVRASLELARHGSTRSTRAPLHHKYASSEGATKLLAGHAPAPATPELQQPPKSRNRAASSSNAVRGNRQPYLSLFPAPPKQTPLNSPLGSLPSTPR
ncbi:hypothetical protein BDV96DRAFT_85321 [Lophiotrema nucula]|uniref:CRIB domain-containing protein n=1 Tax=Lophiotrema nucula TaxID=690887 RepID=A0A6A5Z8T2_9PLEO|nr:hypothetical protein BDV96DRAFT_85321 [Lophiotrema nucula]